VFESDDRQTTLFAKKEILKQFFKKYTNELCITVVGKSDRQTDTDGQTDILRSRYSVKNTKGREHGKLKSSDANTFSTDESPNYTELFD
jgi:hypothetical protein